MNKRGPKVIQICGIRGILTAMFVAICLFAGFVIFPAKVAVVLWNYVATTYISIPQISLWQGCFLWAFVALGVYMLNNKNFAISFQQPMELSDAEMKVLMDRIKMQQQAQRLNAMILKSNDVKIIKKDIQIDSDKSSVEKQESENNINEK